MIRQALPLSLIALFLLGCSGKRFDYHSGTEIPEGPGLFSGEKGYFALYSDEEQKKKKEAPATASADRGKTDAPDAAATPEAEFQEFKDYEAFQRWKATVKDGPEYREFQEWREWKAYRAWKERQGQ